MRSCLCQHMPSREHLEDLLSAGAHRSSPVPQQNSYSARVSAVSTKDFNLKCWRRPQPLMCWGDISEGEHSVGTLESCWVFSFKEYSWCICVDSFETDTRDSLVRWTVRISPTRQFHFFFLLLFLFWIRSLLMISCKMNVVTSLAVDRKLINKSINRNFVSIAWIFLVYGRVSWAGHL